MFDDPVLDAIRRVEEQAEADCPMRTAVMAAALTGRAPSAADTRHLLEEPCESCEAILLATWARTAPRPHVLERAATWPAGGALRRALDAHVASCRHAACQAFATRRELVRPEALEPSRWPVVADRLRAWLTDSFAWSFPAEIAFRSGGGEGPRPRTFLDAAVLVAADEGDPQRTSVSIAESAFAVGGLLLILQDPAGDVLVEHLFADAAASPAVLQVDPRRLTADGVAAFLAPVAGA